MISDNTINVALDILLYVLAFAFVVEFIIVTVVGGFITQRSFGWKAFVATIPIYVICAVQLTIVWIVFYIIAYFVKHL